MRERSPNQFSTAGSPSGLRTGAKSLFRNILAVSPCGSRFCQDPLRSKLPKSFRINILGIPTEKMWSDCSQPKSLFWNILPVSSCGSIFCPDQTRSPLTKSLRMNILEKKREKNVETSGHEATLPSPANHPPDQPRGSEAHRNSPQDRPTANQGAKQTP